MTPGTFSQAQRPDTGYWIVEEDNEALLAKHTKVCNACLFSS